MAKQIKKALVTDDEVVSQILLKALLEPLGYQVTLANNGKEAVNHFKNNPFSLVIMDFNMPKMDGLSAVAEIRRLEKSSNTYIVGLTACNDSARLKEGLKAGMNEVFVKPITQEFIDKVCQHLVCVDP